MKQTDLYEAEKGAREQFEKVISCRKFCYNRSMLPKCKINVNIFLIGCFIFILAPQNNIKNCRKATLNLF